MSRNYIPHEEKFANLFESRTLISNQEECTARELFGRQIDTDTVFKVNSYYNDIAYNFFEEHSVSSTIWNTDDHGNVWHRALVVNRSGAIVEFAAAVSYMDDDIRETLHDDLAPCGVQEFFEAYEKAHEKKHGEPWLLSTKSINW